MLKTYMLKNNIFKTLIENRFFQACDDETIILISYVQKFLFIASLNRHNFKNDQFLHFLIYSKNDYINPVKQ